MLATAPTRMNLESLRPGCLIRVEGTEYQVERSLIFAHDAVRWTEHRLSSDSSGRSVWLEVPENEGPFVVYERDARLVPVADPGAVQGSVATAEVRARGKALYRTIERAGTGKTGELFYVEFACGDRRLTFERHGEDELWQVWHGRAIDRSAVQLTRP